MTAGNLLASAATLFSCLTYTHLAHFSNIFNIPVMSHVTYETIQGEVLMPVVFETWDKLQGLLLAEGN